MQKVILFCISRHGTLRATMFWEKSLKSLLLYFSKKVLPVGMLSRVPPNGKWDGGCGNHVWQQVGILQVSFCTRTRGGTTSLPRPALFCTTDFYIISKIPCLHIKWCIWRFPKFSTENLLKTSFESTISYRINQWIYRSA